MHNEEFITLSEGDCADINGGFGPLIAAALIVIGWVAKDIMDNWKVAKEAYKQGYHDGMAM